MSPNHLATEVAITAYAQFMMADKHRQDMLRLSTPISNKNASPTMPAMSPFMPGMPMLGQMPANMSHYSLNLPPLPFQNHQQSGQASQAVSPKSLKNKLMQSLPQMPQNMTEADFMRIITAGMPMPSLQTEQSKSITNRAKSPTEPYLVQQFQECKEPKYKRESTTDNETNGTDSARRHKKQKHSHLHDNSLNRSVASDLSSEISDDRKDGMTSPVIETKQEKYKEIVEIIVDNEPEIKETETYNESDRCAEVTEVENVNKKATEDVVECEERATTSESNAQIKSSAQKE